MNEFTKEELQAMHDSLYYDHDGEFDNPYENLIDKLQSKIEIFDKNIDFLYKNYTLNGVVFICTQCGKKYNE